MASKAQIGAVIGIEGADLFIRNMRDLAQYTKEFKSELSAVTSSFDDHTRTLANVKSQRETLNRLIQNANDKLHYQRDALNQVNQAASNAEVKDKDWIKVQSDLETQINRTTVELNNYQQALDKLNEENGLTLFVDAFKNTTSKKGEALKYIGDGLTKYLTVPLMGVATASTKFYTDWEAAFTGVQKTVNEVIDENDNLIISYDDIKQQIFDMTMVTASSATEIAKVYEVSGQLGIATEDLEKFVRTMIMLGDTTNVNAEEAAMSLAKILNITGSSDVNKSRKDIEALGSSIVYLGNNYATTEADIIHMSNRLAAAGTIAGLTTTDIFGVATAMSSVGITAEAGGTAMAQTLTNIQKQFVYFRSGAENNLGRIAEIAGMSAKEFADSWETRPVEALTAFIQGLGNLEENEDYLALVLDELGMAGIRQSNMLGSLAEAGDLLSNAVRDSNEAYELNVALMDEANDKYDDFGVAVERLVEQFKLLWTTVGEDIAERLAPIVDNLSEFFIKVREWWEGLDEEGKDAIFRFVVALATIGPALKIGGDVLIFAAKIKGAFGILKGAGIGQIAGEVIGTAGGGAAAGGTGLLGIKAALGEVTAGAWGILAPLGLLIGHFATNKEEAIEFGEALNEPVKQMEELTGYVYDWGNGGIQEAFAGFDEFGEPIMTSVHLISTNVVAEAEATKDGVVDAVDGMVKEVSSRASGMTLQMESAFNHAKYDMITSTQEARNKTKIEFDAMSGEILMTSESIKQSVPPKFKEMGNKIAAEGNKTKNEFKMVITGIETEANKLDLSTAGQHMMETLKRGIENTASRVINAAIGVATGIKQYLEFSLPEKGPLSHFDKSMPDMMQLMASGIKDNSYLVEDAVSDLATNMSDGVGQGQNYNYGGVVINLNVPQGADGRQIVDEIENELASRTIRRRAVFA